MVPDLSGSGTNLICTVSGKYRSGSPVKRQTCETHYTTRIVHTMYTLLYAQYGTWRYPTF